MSDGFDRSWEWVQKYPTRYVCLAVQVSTLQVNASIINTMKRFVVTRKVHVNQALVVKASSASEAVELARKSKFKDWATENAKRTDYNATELA